MKRPTKRELLDKYQTREPTLFVQIDAMKTMADGDNLIQPDEDGFWFQARQTFELLDPIDVRVLISPKTDRRDVRIMLNKLADRIDHDGFDLLDGTKEEIESARGIDGIVESLIRIRGFQPKDFERLFQAAKERFDDTTQKPDDGFPFG
jgi:hypothetical protein